MLHALQTMLDSDHVGEFLICVAALAAGLDERRPHGTGRPDAPPLDLTHLLDHLVVLGRNETLAVVRALGELLPAARHRQQFLECAAEPHPNVPDWLHRMNETELVGATLMSTLFNDWSTVMLELRLPGDHTLTLVQKIDCHHDYTPVDGFCSIDGLEGLQLSFRELAEGTPQEDEISFERIDPADAAAMIHDAIQTGLASPWVSEPEAWSSIRPLFEWATRLAPLGTSGFDTRPMSSEEEEHQLTEQFLASPFGMAHDRPSSLEAVDTLVWYAANFGHQDPWLWSAHRVELFLMSHVLRHTVDELPLLARLPGVLRSFVRFSHAERGIPPSITDRVLRAIDEMEPAFHDQVDYLDLVS